MTRISFILLLLMTGTSLPAQTQYPEAAGSPHGIYIFLDNRIPDDKRIEILRTPKDKDEYIPIAQVTAPSSLADLEGRIRKYETFFSDLGKYNKGDIEKMWDYLRSNSIIDTLPPVNYPVMHLAAGTAYLDTTTFEGKEYIYRINYITDHNESKQTKIVSFPPEVDLPLPVFNNSVTDHNHIYIDWHIIPDPELYSFRVMRRQNMAGKIENAEVERGFYSRGDTLFLVINDQSVRPQTVYEYYIIPLDRLGNPGVASDVYLTSSFGTEDLPVLESFDVKEADEDHRIQLQWKYSRPEMLRSISIYRSDNYDSAFVKIAEVPATDTVHYDFVPIAMENYYYYLLPEGIMFKGVPGAVVGGHSVNRRIPGPPSDFAAVTIHGGVKLYWTHTAQDILGYYIFRDHGISDSLSQSSPFIPADEELMSYVDSSSALRANLSYRYAVKAVNDSYLMSELSDTATATAGIKTNVVPPANLEGGFVNGNIILSWEDMYNTNEYLLGYNVYRRSDPQGEFSRINDELLLFNQNIYIDSLIGEKSQYEYAVTSMDESGTESVLSLSLEVSVPDTESMVIPPYGLRASKAGEGVVLSWPVETENENNIYVYRYEPGSEPIQIAEVKADSFNYTDSTVERGNLYFYFITAVSPAGKESEPSGTVNIRY